MHLLLRNVLLRDDDLKVIGLWDIRDQTMGINIFIWEMRKLKHRGENKLFQNKLWTKSGSFQPQFYTAPCPKHSIIPRAREASEDFNFGRIFLVARNRRHIDSTCHSGLRASENSLLFPTLVAPFTKEMTTLTYPLLLLIHSVPGRMLHD